MLLYRLHQRGGRGGANAVVDVEAIRRYADAHHFRAELVEHLRRDVVRGAVRAVHHQLQAVQIETGRKRALAEFDVTATRIVQPAGLAEQFRWRAGHRFVQLRLDLQLDFVGELVAIGGEKLDAVVVVRIVRRADHHARREAQRTCEIRDARGRYRPGQHHVDARRRETRLQCRFQHVTRHARVLADQHRRTVAALRPAVRTCQHLAGGVAQPQDEVGRDRRIADLAANTIGSEISTCHCFAYIPAHNVKAPYMYV